MAERSSISTDIKALLGALITVALILAAAYFGITYFDSDLISSPGESDQPTMVAYQPADGNASDDVVPDEVALENAAPDDASTDAATLAGGDMARGEVDESSGSEAVQVGGGPGGGPGRQGAPSGMDPNAIATAVAQGTEFPGGRLGGAGGMSGLGAMDPDAMATAVAQGTELPGRPPSDQPGEADGQGTASAMDPAARMTAIAQGTLMPGGRERDNIVDEALAPAATPSPSNDASMDSQPPTDAGESDVQSGSEGTVDSATLPTGNRLFGVARGSGTTLYDEPEGSVIVDLAAGTSVSGMARSVEDGWVLLQVDENTGWAPLSQLVMYGAENLPVFEGSLTQPSMDMDDHTEGGEEVDEQPTESAEAEAEVGAELEPEMTATQAAPPAPTTEQVYIKPIMATVDSKFNRLNVRSGPSTDFDIIDRLAPGSDVVAVARTADSEWIQLALPDSANGSGWVSASFVSLNDAISELPLADNSSADAPLFLMPTPTPSAESSASLRLQPTPTVVVVAPTPAMAPTESMADTESAETDKVAEPEGMAAESSAETAADSITLYAGPSAESKVVKVLEAGLELLELERSDDGAWARVAVLDPPGGVGWVEVTVSGPADIDEAEAPTSIDAEMDTGSSSDNEPSAQAEATPVTADTTDMTDMTEQPAIILAIVISEDTLLNIREQPNTDADIIVKVDPGDVLDALAINLSGDWIQVGIPGEDDETGWVAAEFVDLGDQAELLEVIIPEVTIDRSEIPLVVASSEAASQMNADEQATLEPPKYLPVVGDAVEGIAPGELSGTLVFVAIGGGSIYGYSLETGSLWPITTGFDPAISPDGNTVAFTRDGGDKGLYLVDVDGSNERLIFSGNQRLASPKWSPDGQSIAFSFGYDSDECYLMGRNCIPIDEWGDRDVPDDVTLTTLVNYHIGVVDRDGQDYHELSTLNFARTPDWNEAGIVYQSDAGLQRTADENGATSQEILFDPLKPYFNDPDWQPEGGKIVYMSKEASHWELYSVNPDGSGATPITRPVTALVDEIPSNVSPAWSPDGNTIIFLSNRTDSGEAGNWQLWVMDADGSNQRPLGIDIPVSYSFGDEQVVSWAQ